MAQTGKRRAFGQHFLKDTAIAGLIAETAVKAAVDTQSTTLLEIGPGRGAITLPLIENLKAQSQVAQFVLVERDRDLAKYWRETHPGFPTQVEEADFVELSEERWLPTGKLTVASNLPYSAGTAIFTKLALHTDRIAFMVLMFQAEVAQRLRAEPSTKSWGSLSIWTQNFWDVKTLCQVPPQAFSPPPEVNSEVVTLIPRQTPRVVLPPDDRSRALWESLLKTCFLHRRKMLRSGLPPNSPYRNALELSQVDPTKRAEALSWEEWDRLYQALLRISH